ncbi:MAG: hypothetical protein OXQ90_06500 [Gammaproteobacteria bacterium]|nr:hypothetical protein [Gammaproteobacteria bacterium]
MCTPTEDGQDVRHGTCFVLGMLLVAYLSAATSAGEAAPWRDLVDRTIAETCAIRQLPMKRPVEVRPMTTFEGGYTKGIGSTVWEEHYAQAWRDGWCAVGVYCESKDRNGNGSNTSPNRPRGLYDHSANVLYVDVEADDYAGTVAHEFTHALQHQNFPALNALHLWYNRDLAAAGNAVIEGGAHVVGWSFRPNQRARLCLMTPDEGGSRQPRWWSWAPDDFKAHEMFPHAFGPAISLEALLAGGTEGLDALLANPPLSTLAVLRPALDGPVDFIRLPVADLEAALAEKNCEVGLRNTVGAVGIWGLFNIHGVAPDDSPPEFVDAWAGDRFAHLSCPNANDDEFAWLTRWRTAEAAGEFAQRFNAIASKIAAYGGVLGAVPTAFERDRSVIVATPGLAQTLDRLAESEVRAFTRYDDWIASGCFPQDACYDPDRGSHRPGQRGTKVDNSCPTGAALPPAFSDWLSRIRRARDPSTRRISDAGSLAEAAGRLAVFCATNAARNSDLKNACRASYGSVGYLARLDADPEWHPLPVCLGSQDFRAWLESTYYADADRPFASTSIAPTTYGAALAAGALETSGAPGLRALLDSPPLATLGVLRPDVSAPVEFIRMPRAELAKRGCRIGATDSQGVLGIWNLLMDYGEAPEEDALPSFLLDWRGDRQSFIRCGDDQDSPETGWVWISRWASPQAAETFATHYRAIAPDAAQETGFSASARVDVDHDTVRITAPSLHELTPVLKDLVEVRAYSGFREWVADGCFPRVDCN